MTVKSGQTWSGLVVCKDSTGALATPSVGPVGALYVDGVVNAASVTVSGANPYKWTVTLPTLTAGQCVSMYITATIATIATASVVAEDVADTVRLSDVPAVNVTYLKGSATPVDNLVLALQHADGILAHPQGIADALKLAPTAGDPAAGSVNKHLDDILEDTGTTLPAQIAGLTFSVDPQAMADAMALATTETPAADSVLDRLATIQAVTDELDVSAVTITTTNNAGEITIKRSASFAATVSGLAIPADWLAVIWTLKGAASDDDDDAVCQIRASNPAEPTDGLQRMEGALPTGLSLTAADGSATVNQAGGSVALALKAAATAALTARGDAVWDLRVLRPPAGEADELTTGTADIVYTVTHART